MAASGSRKRYLLGLAIGFIAVPTIALATGLGWSQAPAEAGSASTTTVPADPSTTAGDLVRQVSAQEADVPFEEALAEACGPAGLDLVAKEEAGEISDLEQGVLDALREVCAEEGMPLPAKAEPAPTEQVVIVQEVTSPASTGEVAHQEDDEEEEEEEEEEEDEEDEEEEEEDDERDD